MATDSGVGYFYADGVDTDVVRYWDRRKIHFLRKIISSQGVTY